jgi:hypothetical protein
MKTMFLLGAGASIKAGVPDAYDMTEKLLSQFSSNGDKKYYQVLSFIIGGLIFQKSKAGKSPYEGVNVEEVFNAILLLADRQNLEVSPFVGSWDEMIDRLDRSLNHNPNFDRLNKEIYKSVTESISKAFPTSSASFSESKVDSTLQKATESIIKGRGLSSFTSSTSLGRAIHDYLNESMKKWFSNMNSKSPSSSSFGREFSRALQANEEVSGAGEVFGRTAELMIINLINLVLINNPEKVSYLKPLLELTNKQKRLCVATLNYDNSIELLASSNNVNCTTGINNWSENGEFIMEDEGIFLLKLHGSIDWELIRNQRSIDRPIPHSKVQLSNPKAVTKQYFRPAVIFGQRNKLTTEGPFLDLIRAFQRELSQCQELIISGYSFRDIHINEYLTQWLNNDLDRRIIIVDPNLSPFNNEYIRQIRNHIPTRSSIINKTLEDALPEICLAGQ